MVLHQLTSLCLLSLKNLAEFYDLPVGVFTPKFNLQTYVGHSLTIAAPSVWNTLPLELRACGSLCSFKSKLKR